MIGLIVPALGIVFLVVAGIVGVVIVANKLGREINLRFPITFQRKDVPPTPQQDAQDPASRATEVPLPGDGTVNSPAMISARSIEGSEISGNVAIGADLMRVGDPHDTRVDENLQVTASNSSKDRHLSAILQTLESDEREKLGQFFYVYNWSAEFNHLADHDSYFALHFDIVSSALGNAAIGEDLQGNILYHTGNLLPTTPMAEFPITLTRGTRGRLTVRQYVSNDIASDFHRHANKKVTIDLHQLDISVKVAYPEGSEGATGALMVPSPLTLSIPSVQELEHG